MAGLEAYINTYRPIQCIDGGEWICGGGQMEMLAIRTGRKSYKWSVSFHLMSDALPWEIKRVYNIIRGRGLEEISCIRTPDEMTENPVLSLFVENVQNPPVGVHMVVISAEGRRENNCVPFQGFTRPRSPLPSASGRAAAWDMCAAEMQVIFITTIT